MNSSVLARIRNTLINATCVIGTMFVAIAMSGFVIQDQTRADDWPQWRGPHRDGISAETGLLESWPETGPALAWQISGLGVGYSSVVVSRGRLFTMGRHDADVIVKAIDLDQRKIVWTRKIGETSRHPNSTPTVDGDYVYALDPDGDLVCLTFNTGEILWQKSFEQDFHGRMMSGRGNGESPLIDGDRLICTPGGTDAAIVALNKLSGDIIWKATVPEIGPLGNDGAAFSSVVATRAAGVPQYVQLMGRGLVGVDTRDGRYLWSYNGIANENANIPTPIVFEDFVFAANGYTAGCVLLKLVPESNAGEMPAGVKAEVVYTLNGSQFQNHHGGFVRIGDFLYAGHGNNNGLPTCLDIRTGRVVWKRRGPGVGSAAVVYAGGNLIFRYQDGLVALIAASNRGYKLNGTFETVGSGGDSWSHPVVASGLLFLREQDTLFVYDLHSSGKTTQSKTSGTTASEQNSTITAVRNMGVLVETFEGRSDPAHVQSDLSKRSKIYRYAATTDATPHYVITLTDTNLSSEGTVSPELLRRLEQLSEPFILNMAGSQLSDAGLSRLHELKVAALNLELCTRLTDSGMNHVSGMNALRVLILTGTRISGNGLKQLVSKSNLVALDLELCDGVNDDACQTIGEMKQLQMLVLKKSGFERPGITDVGIQRLLMLTELEVLNLYGNSLSDAGLAHLRAFKKLRELDLSLLDVTDAGIEQIKPLTQLEHLELLFTVGFAGPELTDKVVDSLDCLTNLESLNLTGSKLSDAGLARLAGLKKLKTLQLARTKVTPEGLRTFRAALPGCELVK